MITRLCTILQRQHHSVSSHHVPASVSARCLSTAAETAPAVSSTSHAASPAPAGAPAAVTHPTELTGQVTESSTSIRKRILSGVQPSGKPTLGNYLGAIKNWVGLQDTYETFFCVVDLHAHTVPQDPAELRKATRMLAAFYLAAGIDPKRSSVFVQSHVPAHAELAWLLSCVTPVGWLNRMIQYKEKSRKLGEEVRVGLLTYPVLMAADILLYQADLVPVGEDQKQHLELTRDIAEKFNNEFGGKAWKKRGGRGGRVFKVPEVFTPPAGARVMSLQDGTSKMSKSAENDLSRINLTDDAAAIRNKIKRCKTDLVEGLEFDNPDRPECTNLLTIYQLCTGMTKAEVAAEVASLRWGDFKPRLAEAIVEHLRPMHQTYGQLMSDTTYIDGVLADGADAANASAEITLAAVKDALGLVAPFRRRV
ncbi:MAG: hypothetical protein WDW36_003487 [Sanguina aurantia]